MLKLRLVIADDHALICEGLSRLINDQDDMGIVGAAENGTEAVRLVTGLRPSIVLVDCQCPDLTGVEVTQTVRAATPGTQVIAVTRDRDWRSVAAMRAAGAAGYVLEQSASSELLRAIRTVAAGAEFVDATLPQKQAPDAAAIDDGGTRSQQARRSLTIWSGPFPTRSRAPTPIAILQNDCRLARTTFTPQGVAAWRTPE